eukprot:TRINITY_DN14319_c0_g1_i1.p1 TRINITY_DN14319_c0_g1~~TRINITY_DN14319_c0_g1_i1.p1  ORF type:complete len:377 (+),score=98.98 TRINITY_DN14319_c0_g1_i1:102-1133(+)
MAKIGEGDPRWIVDNRTDGKNVNNWHWNELDYSDKGRDALKVVFKDLPISAPQVKRLSIEKVDTCKGEMTLANRKGKIMFFYDFNLKLEWRATHLDDAVSKGTLELSDITAPDDFDVKITIESENSSNSSLRDVIKSNAIPVIKQKLKTWTDEMRSSGPYQNAASPTLKSSDGAAGSTGSGNSSSNSSASASPAASPAAAAPKSKIKVASFKSRVQFAAPPQLVFETLLDAPRVSAFTQSPAEISATKGSSFKLFNGTITGEITELEPGKKLAQKWRSKDWPEEHFSQVTMAFEPHDGGNCVITLSHANVPDSDFERTRAGWEQFFWQRIRGVFGWQYSVSHL